MKPALLIVDDDDEIRSQLKWALAQDYEILTAEDRVSAVDTFRRSAPAVVLLDLGLPPHPGGPEEGMAALVEILAHDSAAKVIIATGQSDKENALKAIGDGAYDFLCKPVQMDELKVILKRAFHVAQLEHEYHQMQQALAEENFEGMLGASAPIQDVFATIRKVALSEVPVLIVGESGTGKEMAALAIHRRSGRREGPFIAINCGAIPETLLEAELFGHEKGAFTGAHVQRKGKVELAEKGTLFLDEIGELPGSLQVKLLRFLQEQTIEHVGGRTQIAVDARVITATNADLKEGMAAGRFREDLYYRIAVITLTLPALRERPSDIPLLAKAFLRRSALQNKREVREFTARALDAMRQHTWPGNVRELENRVKRAVVMAEGRQVLPEDLELSASPAATSFKTLKEIREEAERDAIAQALERHRGRISRAAEELGVSRPTLYDLMGKLGLGKAATPE